MSEVTPTQLLHQAQNKNENDNWSKIVIAFVFLFVSFFCIFCASQSALWFIDRSQVGASTISQNQADYSQGPRIAVQPVDAAALAAEKARDDEALNSEEDPLISGILVPVPIPARPTPAPPTPIPPIALVPTPTPTPIPTPLPDPTKTPGPTTVPLPPTAQPTPPPTVPPTIPPPTIEPTQTPQVSTPTTAPVTPTPGQVTPTPPPVTPTPEPVTPTSTPEPPTDTPTPIPVPVVNFSQTAYTVDENGSAAIITVLLSNAFGQTVTVNYTSADGTATAGSDYISVSGTLSFTPGQTSNTITIPIANDTIDEAPTETVLLTLSSPSNATLGSVSSATLSITDDDNPPTVQFSGGTYNVTESFGSAIISVILSAKSSFTVTVNYSSSAGTATDGVDYNNVSGVVTFAPDQTLQTFTVPIVADAINEANETVNLALNAPISNATLGTPNVAVLTIEDDDAQPDVRFDQPAYTVIENSGPATITTTLSAPSSFIITVNYTTSNITAIAGSDYLTRTGLLTFTPGQTVQTFTIPITNDTEYEFNETLAITLGNPSNAVLGTPSAATLTIENDDSSRVQFSNATYSVVENVASAVISVVLTNTSPITVTVDYATFGLTATPGSDYITATGTLTFTPGQTNLSFSVPIQNDAFQEPDETVLLKLSNPNGALLGLDTATLTITNDGDVSTCVNESVPTVIGEPNIGPPNGTYREVRCNSAIIVDVSTTPIDTSIADATFDFAYYELGQPNPPTTTTHILLDWIVVEVSPDLTGPWYPVFYWGDTITDTNTNVGQAGFGPATSTTPPVEEDNQIVPVGSLYGTLPYKTGIAIDVDAVAPPDMYRYIRFYVPDGGANDTAQVDAVEILP